MKTEQNSREFRDVINKKRYKVSKEDMKEWGFYKNRWIIGFSLIAILIPFEVNIYLTLAIGLGFIVVSEFRYRTSFLSKCIELNSGQKENDTVKKSASVANIVLYVGLGILLLALANSRGGFEDNLVLVGLAVLSFFAALFYVSHVLTK